MVKAGIGPVAKGDVDGEEGNGTKVPSPCDNENGGESCFFFIFKLLFRL